MLTHSTPEIVREYIVNNVTNTIHIQGATTTNWVTNTVFEVRPEIAAVTEFVGQVSNLTPSPASGIINLVLLALTGALGIVAKIKNDRAKLLDTVIIGVESALNNAEVKKSIDQVSARFGQRAKLNQIVQETV